MKDCVGNELNLSKRNLPDGGHVKYIRFIRGADRTGPTLTARFNLGNHPRPVVYDIMDLREKVGLRCPACNKTIWAEAVR